MSFKLKVTDETPLLSTEAKDKLKELPKAIESIVKMGALHEQLNHAYVNRTGNLQRSTQGTLYRSSSSDIRADLDMGADYASYVVNKGLSEINTVAKDIEEQLSQFLETYFLPKF